MAGPFPTSLAQRGVWFTEQLADLGSVYHVPLTVTLDGAADLGALRQAWGMVLERHPMLACAVRDERGVPWLIPTGEDRGPAVEDLMEVPAGERAAVLDRLRRREILRPFDLERGPLVRLTLVVLAPDRLELVIVAHHLVFDGRSKEILVRDLAACYRAAIEGSPPELPPSLVGHADHVAGELIRVEAAMDAARAFWTRTRAGGGTPALPGLRQDCDPVGEGASVRVELPPVLAAARGLGLTRFELMLAAVHALLHRCGTDPSAVAVDLDTRPPGLHDHVGMFVNQLPIVARPGPSTTFRELAGALRADLTELYRCCEVPLARAVQGVRPGPAMAPVSLSYRDRSEPVTFPGLRATVDWSTFNLSARNLLHVHAVGTPAAMEVHLRYPAHAIDRSSVERIGRHLATLLAGIAADPDARLSDLPLMDAEERRRVLATSGPAVAAQPDPATVPERVRARAGERPDDVALASADGVLTYGALCARAGRLAGRLRREGVGPDVRVAVCAGRSLDLPVAMLAVLEAGGACVPLDPAQPPARLATTLRDAGAALLLTERRLLATLPHPAPPVLLLDDPATWTEAADAAAGRPATPANLAYVLYTSGSTGRPKGVAVEHGAVATFLDAIGPVLRSGPDAVWLALTSFAFDMSVLELFLPLVTGGTAVVSAEAGGRRADDVVRLVRQHAVTHVQATPSGWELLLAAGFDEPGVTAVSAGEPISRALAAELRRRSARLVNAYGPTEATVDVTAAVLDGDDGARPTIGAPLPHARVLLLDGRLEPVPAGVAAELCIGGPGLARGYQGRPDLTAASFVPDPHGPPGARLYRTGDRARHLPDGRIDLLGRRDGQVKIRGHRVELGEVEACLLEQPDVRQAAVALREDASGERRLIAYVATGPGAASSTETVRAGLARVLPDAMLPDAVVLLDRVPLTGNGKLDRGALPDPPATPEPAGATDEPALDELTGQVAAIFREVLRVERVEPGQSLFGLGGHSLSITQIASRLRRRLGVDLPLHVFYDTPTVAGVVEAIQQPDPSP